MRARRSSAGALLVGAVLLVACGGGSSDGGAPEGAVGDTAPTEQQASICAEMVQEAVEHLLGESLDGPPVARRAGRRYTCRYEVAGGSLRLAVNDVGTSARARARVEERATRSDVIDRLSALGDGGFEAADGSVVLSKDEFVLTVDPNDLPATTAKRAVSLGTAVAVMDCW